VSPKVNKSIRGSGGGGGGGSARYATVDVDTLASRSYLKIVDLIGEGEIQGLVDGGKSIYLDGTQLIADDGTANFRGVTVETRYGTQSQTYIPNFGGVESETIVGVEVKYDNPIIRELVNPNITRGRVRISIPQLTSQDQATGDVHGYGVRVNIQVQPNGGSYTTVASRTVNGKASSKYEFSIDFPLSGDAPWNVKVIRDSVDSPSLAIQNTTIFESFTEIIDAKLRYPNSALVAMKIDSQQFQNVPTRSYDMKLLKIKIPDNYNPTTRVYTGTWGGTFTVAWTDNPAWCLYALITDDRFGLGKFIDDSLVDKWTLYTIAQYCDELVPDGFGGYEPRFTCNTVITERVEAFVLLQNIATVFRGMIYWSAGSVTATQDAPTDASYLFTPANVIDGLFTYQGAARKIMHSVALVSWNDPEDDYKLKVEYVEDQDAIALIGVQETDVLAFGCTSRGQAHRLGKWLLFTEQNESEVLNFKVGLDGAALLPGMIIKVADPVRAGVRMGGRIGTGATTTVIPVDYTPTGSLAGYTLSVMLSDGTLEERNIVNYSGQNITVLTAYTSAPQAQSVWVMKSSTVEPQTFRVIGIAEEDDGTYSINAIKYVPGKYAAVEYGLDLETRSYTTLTDPPAVPTNLAINESLYRSPAGIRTKIIFSWDRVDRAGSYFSRYRLENGNFIDLPETSINEIEVLEAIPGNYTFEVYAKNTFGKRSNAASITKNILGLKRPPGAVQNFTMIPGEGIAILNWDAATDLDVIVGGSVRIRHTPDTSSQEWANARDIIPAIAGTATTANPPLLSGTYMAKFVDSSGIESDTTALIVTSIPDIIALNVVATVTESPTFSGTKYYMDIIDSKLALSGGTLIDDVPDIDLLGNIDFPGPVASYGTYDFATTVDLGGVWPFRMRSTMDVEAFDVGNLVDQRLEVDDWEDVDGTAISDVNATLYVRTTEDDPSGSPTWSDWKFMSAASYVARGIQWQVRATSETDTHSLFIHTLEVVVDMADRTAHAGPIASGTGTTYRVDYVDYFYATPAVGITGMNMSTGDYYTITNSDYRGFDIVFKNAAGTTVSRDFSWIAKGYGRKVG
jgi:predicted phage tail protein